MDNSRAAPFAVLYRLVNMADSLFTKVEVAPPIEVFALTAAYNEDTHEPKVNLGVGGMKRIR